jgi:hypothetical protein
MCTTSCRLATHYRRPLAFASSFAQTTEFGNEIWLRLYFVQLHFEYFTRKCDPHSVLAAG